MKKNIINLLRRYNRRLAISGLKSVGIYDEINEYMNLTKSTGVSWSDFWELYKKARKNKPKSILECGPGASTLVLAHALKANEKEGFPGLITAIEEFEEYLNMSKELLPKSLHKYVNYILSPRIDDYHEIFRGVRYRDIPDKEYDFVFIDGPEHHSPTDNQFCFDFDFLHVLKKTNNPIYGIIDYRLSTGFVLQTILGNEIVKYDFIKEIGIIEPCTSHDIKKLDLEKLKQFFDHNGKFIGNTIIRIYN